MSSVWESIDELLDDNEASSAVHASHDYNDNLFNEDELDQNELLGIVEDDEQNDLFGLTETREPSQEPRQEPSQEQSDSDNNNNNNNSNSNNRAELTEIGSKEEPAPHEPEPPSEVPPERASSSAEECLNYDELNYDEENLHTTEATFNDELNYDENDYNDVEEFSGSRRSPTLAPVLREPKPVEPERSPARSAPTPPATLPPATLPPATLPPPQPSPPPQTPVESAEAAPKPDTSAPPVTQAQKTDEDDDKDAEEEEDEEEDEEKPARGRSNHWSERISPGNKIHTDDLVSVATNGNNMNNNRGYNNQNNRNNNMRNKMPMAASFPGQRQRNAGGQQQLPVGGGFNGNKYMPQQGGVFNQSGNALLPLPFPANMTSPPPSLGNSSIRPPYLMSQVAFHDNRHIGQHMGMSHPPPPLHSSTSFVPHRHPMPNNGFINSNYNEFNGFGNNNQLNLNNPVPHNYSAPNLSQFTSSQQLIQHQIAQFNGGRPSQPPPPPPQPAQAPRPPQHILNQIQPPPAYNFASNNFDMHSFGSSQPSNGLMPYPSQAHLNHSMSTAPPPILPALMQNVAAAPLPSSPPRPSVQAPKPNSVYINPSFIARQQKQDSLPTSQSSAIDDVLRQNVLREMILQNNKLPGSDEMLRNFKKPQEAPTPTVPAQQPAPKQRSRKDLELLLEKRLAAELSSENEAKSKSSATKRKSDDSKPAKEESSKRSKDSKDSTKKLMSKVSVVEDAKPAVPKGLIVIDDPDYVRKMEEQKRKREQLLRLKEEKRSQRIQEMKKSENATPTVSSTVVLVDKKPLTNGAAPSTAAPPAVARTVIAASSCPEPVKSTSKRIVTTTPTKLATSTSSANAKRLVIQNLSLNTSETSLMVMCSSISLREKILKIDMHKNNSNEAEICFADRESADKFYKQFNRTLVDLSMITMKLV